MSTLSYFSIKHLPTIIGYLLFWSALLVAPVQVSAQEAVSTHFNTEDGLIQNKVLAITQDRQGFMWFGTEKGLSRFDGLKWRSFKNIIIDKNKPATSILIRSILCDRQNKLWMGTSLGLIIFDPITEKFSQVHLPYPNQPEVRQIITDRSGNIWIASRLGVAVITRKKQLLVYENNFNKGDIFTCHAVYESSDGKIWYGTIDGLFEANLKANKIVLIRATGPSFLQKEYITSIKQDRYGRFWFGSYAAGIILCEYQNGTFTRAEKQPILPHGAALKIRSIITLLNQKIAVATANGLFFFKTNNLSTQELNNTLDYQETLPNSSIHSLFQQNSGTIWIGTYYSGLDLIKPTITPFNYFTTGSPPLHLSHSVVSSICERNPNELWIATEGGGINIINNNSKRLTYLSNQPGNNSSISSNFVKTLFKDSDGNLWLGTFSGYLDVVNVNTNAIEHRLTGDERVTEVNSMVEDKLQRLWITTNAGLKVFKRKGTNLAADELGKHKLLKSFLGGIALKDSKQRLWFISENKVLRIENNTINAYQLQHQVNTIAEHQNTLFIGLENHGLMQFDEQKNQFQRYHLNGLLHNRSIMSISFDQNHCIWLASDSGLLKVSQDRKIVTQYTKADGLISTNFNANAKYQKNHRLFLGTLDGLIYFDPNQIKDNPTKSSVVITAMRLYGVPVKIDDSILSKSINYTKHMELNYDQNSLTFEFALLDFIKPEKNTFRYQLIGSNKKWTTIKSPEVTFNNLAPGTYTLQVSGNNGSPNWTNPVTLSIKIFPPFWATWWAYVIYALLVTSIIFFVSRYFVLQTLLKREDELHQYKINFFTNVSHEIRTHLSLITPPIAQLALDENLGLKQKEKLKGVAGNANRLVALVNELLDFRKAESKQLKLSERIQDLLPILEDCLMMFAETSSRKQITTLFEQHNLQSAELLCDAFQLKKVVVNLLTNAYKFTQDGGMVRLEVKVINKEVIISIEDNGRGISKEHLDKLFENYYQVADHGFQNTGYGIGLALSKVIVELHEGSILVTSSIETMNENGCTTFVIVLPQRQKEVNFSQTNVPQKRVISAPLITAKPANQLPFISTLDEEIKPVLLLAEDNVELAAVLTDILNPYYQLLLCSNGQEAWEHARRHMPDLIISDVGMPEMSGFEFCKLIKSDVATNHIPFILLTAKTDTEDVIAGLSHGADAYLTKPFAPMALLHQVNNLIVGIQRIRTHVSQLFNKNHLSDHIFSQLNQSIVGAENQKFLQQLIEQISNSLENPEFGVNELAKMMNMSTPILYKKVKSITNLSVNDFIKGMRMKKASELLQTKLFTVYQVSYMVGFLDSKYFSKEFKKFSGKLPSEWANFQAS